MITFDSKIVSYKLAEKQEGADVNETIIPNDVKLPADSPARVKCLRAEGKKWYLTVVYHEATEQPFALFCHTNAVDKTAQTSDVVEKLIKLARAKGIFDTHIETTIAKCQKENNVGKISRTISLLLRHGVLIKNIVSVLDDVEDVYVGSFLFQIKKFLAQYIKNGEVAENSVCPNCGSKNIIFQEGCKACLDCHDSKCG